MDTEAVLLWVTGSEWYTLLIMIETPPPSLFPWIFNIRCQAFWTLNWSPTRRGGNPLLFSRPRTTFAESCCISASETPEVHICSGCWNKQCETCCQVVLFCISIQNLALSQSQTSNLKYKFDICYILWGSTLGQLWINVCCLQYNKVYFRDHDCICLSLFRWTAIWVWLSLLHSLLQSAQLPPLEATDSPCTKHLVQECKKKCVQVKKKIEFLQSTF